MQVQIATGYLRYRQELMARALVVKKPVVGFSHVARLGLVPGHECFSARNAIATSRFSVPDTGGQGIGECTTSPVRPGLCATSSSLNWRADLRRQVCNLEATGP